MAKEKFNQEMVGLDVIDVMNEVRADDKKTLTIKEIMEFRDKNGCFPDEWYNEKDNLSDLIYEIAHKHDKDEAKSIISELMIDIFDSDIIDQNKDAYIYYLAIYLRRKYEEKHYNQQ